MSYKNKASDYGVYERTHRDMIFSKKEIGDMGKSVRDMKRDLRDRNRDGASRGLSNFLLTAFGFSPTTGTLAGVIGVLMDILFDDNSTIALYENLSETHERLFDVYTLMDEREYIHCRADIAVLVVDGVETPFGFRETGFETKSGRWILAE